MRYLNRLLFARSNRQAPPAPASAPATAASKEQLANSVDGDVRESDQNSVSELEEDDWILLDACPPSDQEQTKQKGAEQLPFSDATTRNSQNKSLVTYQKQRRRKQMALDTTDVELIKASWNPAREDPVAAGLLLFRGLFTKFPQYLELFNKIPDLDIETLQDNKVLLRHGVKVIDTVTFVVDSIGDDSKTGELNQALVTLVKVHLKRKIGLPEFRNLGIVLIDFICDFNRLSNETRIDTNLVAAWTKLYGSILDLVEREEANSEQQ